MDEVNIFYELQKGQKPNDSIRYKTITCQAGSVIFSVDSQGDVYPCQSFHFADFRLGNFLTQTLEEIYNSQIATMLRVSNDVEYKATCRECKLKYICAGGCAANTYALEGNILNYPQTMCPYYKAGALKRLKNVEFYRLLILLFMCFLTPIVRAQTPDSLLYKNALRLFADAQSICETDRGELWGENLWGPVLLVRDSDKIAFTNEPKLLPFSIKVDSLYCGILDSSVIVAGSAIRFMNMEVALVPLLSLSDSIMIQVFIHELYHRFQNNHFDMEEVVYDNAHIDTRIGRTLVLCELIELAKSLNCSVEDQHSHIKRAIEFRKWRWTLFPEKIKDECKFEFHEGLALYTQYHLCLRNSTEVLKQLCLDVENLLLKTSLSRQYGYYMGALYSYLNDVDPSWRNYVYPSMNICEITSELYDIDFTESIDTMELKHSEAYLRITQIADSLEIARNLIFNKVAQSLRTKSVIYVRTDNYQMGFNPACVLGLDELGNYFTVIELKGDFGSIYSEHGCLISNKPVLILPSESTKRINGESPGFSIKLNKGWRLKKSKEGYEIVHLKK